MLAPEDHTALRVTARPAVDPHANVRHQSGVKATATGRPNQSQAQPLALSSQAGRFSESDSLVNGQPAASETCAGRQQVLIFSDVDKREVEALHLTIGQLPYQRHVAAEALLREACVRRAVEEAVAVLDALVVEAVHRHTELSLVTRYSINIPRRRPIHAAPSLDHPLDGGRCRAWLARVRSGQRHVRAQQGQAEGPE